MIRPRCGVTHIVQQTGPQGYEKRAEAVDKHIAKIPFVDRERHEVYERSGGRQYVIDGDGGTFRPSSSN
jgi:hypothetical protein